MSTGRDVTEAETKPTIEENPTGPKASDEFRDWPAGVSGKLFLKLGIAKSFPVAVIYSAITFIAIAFVPLLFMCVSEGTLLPSDGVKIPLFGDFVALSRLLVAAPLLIVSDALTRPFLVKAVVQFHENYIENDDIPRFERLVRNVISIRHSLIADGIILAIAFISSPFNPAAMFTTEIPAWQVSATTGLTAAGWWNACVSQPIFRFVVLGWYFRYLVWVYFLIRVSRMKLRLAPTHPDNACGLAFISVAQTPFCLVAFALSSMISCVIAQTVIYHQEKLNSFNNFAIAFVVVALLFFVGPLLLFTPVLIRTRQKAIFTYGALCHELNSLFASKWMQANVDRKPLMECPDASAITDLNAQYTLIQGTRPIVFDRQFVLVYVVSICLPALPLIAMVIPLKDLVMQIVKAIT